MEWYWVAIIIALIIALIAGAIVLLAYSIKSLKGDFQGARQGQTCTLSTDCAGWGPATTDVACCLGVCVQKKADWANIGYCPNECRGCPGCPEGSCGPPYGATAGVGGVPAWHWPRIVGEPCSLNTDCQNFGTSAGDNACCGGICTPVEIDFAGVGYCPNECRGCAGCPVGSCGDWHTPREQGEPCALDPDCAGWSVFGEVACCNFHCVTKDESVQTCPAYCDEHPDVCNAPYPGVPM